MRPGLALSVFLLSTLLPVACVERPQSPNWQVELRLVPEAPRPLEEATFAVRVQARTGEAVTGAEVEVELWQGSERTGENRLRLRETQAGIYTAPGKFPLPDDWQVEVRVEKGAQHQAKEFRFAVR